MTREDRTKGFFVSFDYSSDALREIDGFFRKSGKAIIALTVREMRLRWHCRCASECGPGQARGYVGLYGRDPGKRGGG